MSELNPDQKELCKSLEGFIVVDAGPGTGKTHSIVQRYVNIINKGIEPMEVLMLTFTRNAAEEMETRISARMSELIAAGEDPDGYLKNAMENLKVSTIDSFCLDVVLNSPEDVRDFFDPDDKNLMLSRSAALSENETLNKQYFSEFYSRFITDHGTEYVVDGVDYAALFGEKQMDLYELIQKLMSRGIIPKKKGWMGLDKDTLIGKREKVFDAMKGRQKSLVETLKDIRKKDEYAIPDSLMNASSIPDEILEEIAWEDREGLLKLIHDAYFSYITYCIKENRLTFGLCELFALISLIYGKSARRMYSVDYLTIDEFQDTNELQMKICLLILKQPNMCVVGDWKQGIFGFRYVSVDNITKFDKRVPQFMEDLEQIRVRGKNLEFPFEFTKAKTIEFTLNYRSSDLIIRKGFDALDIPGSKEDVPTYEGKKVELTSVKNELYTGRTGINFFKGDTKDDEVESVINMITEYASGDYEIVDEDENHNSFIRKADFGDIAVLCRSSAYCTKIFNLCQKKHIPVFLQGDIEIMSSEQGKLALAWLRYLNNPADRRGLVTILDHLEYPLSEIEAIVEHRELVPDNIRVQLGNLNKKKRRITDLITAIFDFYGMNDEIVHTIINVLSSAHRNSLMTVSDMIRLIEDDIEASTKYNVEPLIDRKAVKIQTIHKSKGLEYPIVIISGIIQGSFPSPKQGDSTLRFNDEIGVRCTNSYLKNADEEGHETVVKSWKTALLRAGYPIDYSEERRLLFVAMTRAKQYITLTTYEQSNGISKFYEHYEGDKECTLVDPVWRGVDNNKLDVRTEKPEILAYEKKRMSVSAHDLMSTLEEPPADQKKEGKGTEYGDKVHKEAYRYLKWHEYDNKYEEMDYITKMIDQLKVNARLSGEIRCVLPVDDVSVKGTIDLLAEFDDRYEIHDYKTDPDQSYEERYILQMSIYYHVVASMGKKVDCYLDYVYLGKRVPVKPRSLDYIRERIAEYKRQLEKSV